MFYFHLILNLQDLSILAHIDICTAGTMKYCEAIRLNELLESFINSAVQTKQGECMGLCSGFFFILNLAATRRHGYFRGEDIWLV